MWSAAPDDPLPRLEVAPLSPTEFESALESFEGRTFGGEILAKAVSAALHTCPERSVHSLHAYFLRPVPPEQPVRFIVRARRDGRRLSSRCVVVRHGGRDIAEVSISLTAIATGPAFEESPLRLDVPAPEDLPTATELADAEGWPGSTLRPLEWRYIEPPWRQADTGDRARWRAWIRPSRPLPDEARYHDAALAYLSDHGSLGTLQRYFGPAFQWDASTSLDHAFWIHRPFRWNDWILMESRSDAAFAGRALTERRLYTPDGRRIASMAQEALFATKEAP